jgi:hypothetical protein
MSTTDPALLNYVIRMVVPLKREFGESLDVQQFMGDKGYSQRILEQARSSQDQRLRDYAEYIGRHLLGARTTSAAPAAPATSATPHAAASGAQAAKSTQAEPLARMPPNRAPSAPPAPVAAPRSAPAAAPAVGGEPTAEELRARMLKKYTSGLR